MTPLPAPVGLIDGAVDETQRRAACVYADAQRRMKADAILNTMVRMINGSNIKYGEQLLLHRVSIDQLPSDKG